MGIRSTFSAPNCSFGFLDRAENDLKFKLRTELPLHRCEMDARRRKSAFRPDAEAGISPTSASKRRKTEAGASEKGGRESLKPKQSMGKHRPSDDKMKSGSTAAGKKAASTAYMASSSADMPDYTPAELTPFHQDISPDLPAPKQLQKLVEMVMEAESDNVNQLYQGKEAFISQAFEEVSEKFMMAQERATIIAMRKLGPRDHDSRVCKAAQEPMVSNPKNEERAAEHAKLMDALNKFTEEAREWERLAVAPAPGGGAVAAASMESISAEDRALLSDQGLQELRELSGWAENHILAGLDAVRGAVTEAEDRSERAERLHRRLMASVRRTALQPFAAHSNPKDLLRAVTAA